MSLLSIVQDACRDLSLPVLTSVVGNAATHAPLMLRCAKEELNDLANKTEWQRLRKEHTFTATASSVQVTASAIPTDFHRMVNDTFWNRTQREQFSLIDEVVWQSIQSSVVTLVYPAYLLRGNTILTAPNPTSGDTLAYTYVSTMKARSSGGTEQANWQADTDTSVFPEDIVTLGVAWRYLQAKGFEHTGRRETYERRVTDLIGRDGSKPRLYSDPPIRVIRPRPPNTPETLVF